MNPVRDRKRFFKAFPSKESRNIMKDCDMGSNGEGEIEIPRVSNGVKKGFALITVLAVLLMIALGSAAILQSMGSQTNIKALNVQEVQSQGLAEAGMQHALWRCKTNTAGCVGVTPCCIVEDVTIEGERVAIRLPSAGEISICVGTAAECP